MKIAVACDEGEVPNILDKLYGFEIRDNKVINSSIPNPGHRPGFLPKFLHEKGLMLLFPGYGWCGSRYL